MSDVQMTFQRYEMKYLLDEAAYRRLRKKLEGRMKVDQYGKTTICNVYYDTPDARLIRMSLEKPVYKEKLRVRSYGVPQKDGIVFLELKKKYKGVVYKRRETMILQEASRYLEQGEMPGFDSQVLHEIDWFLKYYQDICPAMYIAYDRIALYGLEDSTLRITFDCNIRWRDEQLSLPSGSWGDPLLKQGQYLMEIKIAQAMPLWLGELLDRDCIYPVSFSKYGTAYQKQQRNMKSHTKTEERYEDKGGSNCA